MPQVGGPARNLSLVRYFGESMLQRQRATVQRRAKCNFFDVGDMLRLIHFLVGHDISPHSTQSLASVHSVHDADVLKAIREPLDIEPIFDVVDAEENYDTLTDFVNRHFESDNSPMKKDYSRAVPLRHAPSIASKFRLTT